MLDIKGSVAVVTGGGGGIGLLFEPDCGGELGTRGLFFLSIDLGPTMPAPLVVTARLRHTSMDSAHRTNAGFAFDFSADPAHEPFLAQQLGAYIDRVQHDQAAGARKAA